MQEATSPQRRTAEANKAFFARVKRLDLIAKWVISTVGILIIISVIGILFLIAEVALPLFLPADASEHARFSIQSPSASDTLAVGVDEYLETGFVLDKTGKWSFYRFDKGELIKEKQSSAPDNPNAHLKKATLYGNLIYNLEWDDGSVTVEQATLSPKFTEFGRVMEHDVVQLVAIPANREPLESVVRIFDGEEGKNITNVQLMPGNTLRIFQQGVTVDFLGNEEAEEFSSTITDNIPGEINHLVLDNAGQHLYASTVNGYLLHWDLRELGDPQTFPPVKAFADSRTITALGLIFGDTSIIVGDSTGLVTTWFSAPVEAQSNTKKLKLIHELSKHSSPVVGILASLRDKSIMSLDEKGTIMLSHMTSERQLLDLTMGEPLKSLNASARGNGVVALDNKNNVMLWSVDNPHPEISWQALFGKVWYEGYFEPEYVWQSSSASDDFEPKLSLMPLIFGSFKGTFYALIFAVPLALLGAIYTSQFAKDTFRHTIKPAVEVMAAMPSVIIGFLAALWLAPILEGQVVTFFLSLVILPIALLVFVGVWWKLRETDFAKQTERGFEFALMVPFVVLTVVIAAFLAPGVESTFFGGDFRQWLFQEAGSRYDQRNSIIIAFGLGFMVVPIIFTISDDALSNVPSALKAASLALGASRWQTVWRIVIPSASPGIFAAIIIGFGRAVGETMVVLMATGNTPIMDWSMFNGMRTLSANIAVELPEAPVHGTLYRILFLSAVVLFLITFVLNTLAELIRHRLRKKYGQL